MTTETDVKEDKEGKEEVDVIHTKRKEGDANDNKSGVKILPVFIGAFFMMVIAALLYYEYSGNKVSNYVSSLQGKFQPGEDSIKTNAGDVDHNSTAGAATDSKQITNERSFANNPYQAMPNQNWVTEVPPADTNQSAVNKSNQNTAQANTINRDFQPVNQFPTSLSYQEPAWVEEKRQEMAQRQREFQAEVAQHRQEMFEQQKQLQQQMIQRQQELQNEMLKRQQTIFEQQRTMFTPPAGYYNRFNQPSAFTQYPSPVNNGNQDNSQSAESFKAPGNQFNQPNYTYNHPLQAYPYNARAFRPYHPYYAHPQPFYQPWGGPVYR